jgi:ABC-type dipeptide/oligopeptide/nickel transport system ATPase component
VLVTHDMGVHANVADRIAIMYAGKIVEGGADREDLRMPAAPLHALPDQLAAPLWRQVRCGERARQPAVTGKFPSRLPVPPQVPARVMDICKSRCLVSPRWIPITKPPAGMLEKTNMQMLLEVEV